MKGASIHITRRLIHDSRKTLSLTMLPTRYRWELRHLQSKLIRLLDRRREVPIYRSVQVTINLKHNRTLHPHERGSCSVPLQRQAPPGDYPTIQYLERQ